MAETRIDELLDLAVEAIWVKKTPDGSPDAAGTE